MFTCSIYLLKYNIYRECPVSLVAAQGLLALGVKGAEVASFMMSANSSLTNLDWLSQWIKAQAHTASKEYTNAAQTFKLLDNKVCKFNTTFVIRRTKSFVKVTRSNT